jgi:hypothetical protein
MTIRTVALTATLLFAMLIAAASWTPASALSWNFKGGQCVNTKTGKAGAASNCLHTSAPPSSGGQK